MLATLATVLVCFAEPQGPALSFQDFTSDLDRSSFTLVVGSLGKITEGKKERLKGSLGNMDEGGSMTSVSGTVYSKVQATAKLEVGKALHGTKESVLQVGFEMQHAKLNDGSVKRHFLLTPRVPLDDDMLALWFLERDKGKLVVNRIVRLDPRTRMNQETFTRLCEDLYTLNVRIRELKTALELAMRTRATDKPGAIATLQKALAKKVEWKETQGERWASMELSPHEQKARRFLEELGVRADSRPSSEDPPLEGGKRG